jgi:ribosomal protein S18 acetylase RimI-like enzyme
VRRRAPERGVRRDESFRMVEKRSPTDAVVRVAAPSDQHRIVAVLALAFSTDPGARWTYPDPHEYLDHFPDIIRAFGGEAFRHGTAHYVDGYLGAALWLPPNVRPREDEMMALMQRTVSKATLEDFSSVMEQSGRYRPTEPHWYLPLAGVDPAHQSSGYGSALMKHALAACDREQKLAYLESTNPRNVSFYQRHGFEVLGTVQVGSSPTGFSMLRRPRS